MSANAAPAPENTPLPGGGAPAIASTDETGLKPLFCYISALAPENYHALAETEAARLAPWFDALSRHFKDDLDHDPNLFAGKRERIEKLTEPGNLKRLFMTVADQTNKVLLSEIVIAPSTVYEDRTLSRHIFGDKVPYHSETRYDGRNLLFGFDRIHGIDPASGNPAANVFGILAVNDKMLGIMRPQGAQPLLDALREVTTIINHDCMHHFHMDEHPPEHFYAGKPAGYHMNDPRDVWMRNFDRDIDNQVPTAGDIESWQIMHHARTMQFMDLAPLQAGIEKYFSELKRIAGELMAQAQSSGDPDGKLQTAREAVDYFNTVMGVTLMRALPFNHPLMAKALAGMEAADPAPEMTMQQAPAVLDRTKGSLKLDRSYRDMIEGYAAAGLKTVDDNTTAISYAQMKTLKLMREEGLIAQLMSQGRTKTYLGERQAKNARIGLELIDAMAKMTDFEPR